MMVHGGVEVQLHAFLTLAVDGELSASSFGSFTPGNGAPEPIFSILG
jgi:hypothetical protein